MVDLVVLVAAEEPRRGSASSASNASQSGGPSCSSDRPDPEASTILGRRSGPAVGGPGRDDRRGGRDPSRRTRCGLGGRRLGGEDAPLEDRQPAHRQQGAEGREELEGVVADDIDPPAPSPVGLGHRTWHRALVAQSAASARDDGSARRRRTPGNSRGGNDATRWSHPHLGVAAQQLSLEPSQVRHGQEPILRENESRDAGPKPSPAPRSRRDRGGDSAAPGRQDST